MKNYIQAFAFLFFISNVASAETISGNVRLIDLKPGTTIQLQGDFKACANEHLVDQNSSVPFIGKFSAGMFEHKIYFSPESNLPAGECRGVSSPNGRLLNVQRYYSGIVLVLDSPELAAIYVARTQSIGEMAVGIDPAPRADETSVAELRTGLNGRVEITATQQ